PSEHHLPLPHRRSIRSYSCTLENPTTRAEVQHLVDSQDHAELSRRFAHRIAFGTAGLRGPMQAGPACMNDLTILQASQGLERYAAESIHGARERGIVVGHDHRHNSSEFARLTAGVFRRAGWEVYQLKGLVHTPMVPFATKKLGAALGVMITASHNPAKGKTASFHLVRATAYKLLCCHNGYKVYWENAVQIIPPHDTGIATKIDESLEVDMAAWESQLDASRWDGTEELVEQYMEMASELSSHKSLVFSSWIIRLHHSAKLISPSLYSTNASTSLLFTYTPMHGVGEPFALSALEAFGFKTKSVSVVEEQRKPDPDFPTVKFPNPEEKGALDLAMAHADRIGSTIVLANDPDAGEQARCEPRHIRFPLTRLLHCRADRFCAAEKVGGKWNVFTGDQLGALLGSWALARYKETGAPIEKLAMCASTVSSKMLRSMAQKEGFVFRETLTGFKCVVSLGQWSADCLSVELVNRWIGNEMMKLEQEGFTPVFAYEEAIGFMNGTEIRDKDGVTALALFAEMAAALATVGKSLSLHLDSLYYDSAGRLHLDRYGFHATSNSYFICRDTAKTDRIFSTLRFGRPDVDSSTAPPSALALPTSLGGYTITHLRDLTVGYDSAAAAPTLPVDRTSHMISFAVGSVDGDGDGDGVEVVGTVRTSGTEPKIKFYLEARGADRAAVRAKLERVREALAREWLRSEENGLEKP
ncbi:SPOSA6832_02532, partial [Sporobolomyces salmonicolor]